MTLIEKIAPLRRTMVLFFVVDTSGSMSGSKIGSVNTAIEETLPLIQEVSDENSDAQIKIAVLEFSAGVTWHTPDGPVPADQFHWNYLNAAGTTDLGAACKALNEKLSTEAFMKEATGAYAPVIILLSDGDPTDNWQGALKTLKENKWFKVAVKVALAIGDEANMDILKEFTGHIEAVLEVHNTATLKKMIKVVSVRASQVASKSSNVNDAAGDEAKQIQLNDTLGELKVETATAPDQGPKDW